MSVSWNLVPPSPVLGGAEGELVSVRVFVEPRLLEELLEALASVSFPVNPQIFHQPGPDTLVEFPAYSGRLSEVRSVLKESGFDTAPIIVRPMLNELSSSAIALTVPN
jgi:hypothetical protein